VTPPPPPAVPPSPTPAEGEADAETDVEEEEKRRRRYIVLALLVLLLLLLCLAGFLYWLFAVRDSGDTPDPVDSTATVTATTAAPTTAAPTTDAPTTTAPATPTAEPTTAAPTTDAPASITVPNVTGKTVSEAIDALEEVGFTKIKVVLDTATGTEVTGDSKYDGHQVIGVNPTAGSSVVGTTEIILIADSKSGVGSG
jgi:cytoskeletal protein RodZ